MIDAASVQAIAAVGALMLALITLIGGWVYWLVRDLRREIDNLRDDMRRSLRELQDEMRRNHRELLVLLTGHTHGDGTPPVFHQLPDLGN